MGLVIGQMGILSALLFMYFFYKICRRIVKYKKGNLEYAVIAYTIGTVFEAFISESSINFVGSGIAFILLGMLLMRSSSKDDKGNWSKCNYNENVFKINEGYTSYEN